MGLPNGESKVIRVSSHRENPDFRLMTVACGIQTQ